MQPRRFLLATLVTTCVLVLGLVVWLGSGGGGGAVDSAGAPLVTGVSHGASSSILSSPVAEEADAERSDTGPVSGAEQPTSRPDRASLAAAKADETDPHFDVLVVDPAGEPVLGAQVLWLASFELEGDATVQPYGLTDAAGRLEVPSSQAFSHLGARAHGFAGSRPIDVRHRAPERGEPAERVRITLLPGTCTMHLRVQDERGSPVLTARVLLGILGTRDDATRPLTLPLEVLDLELADLPGELVVRNLPRGEHALVAFHDELGLWRGSIVLEPDAPTRVEVTLTALPRSSGSVLAGRVTDADGTPLADWAVWALPKKAGTGYPRSHRDRPAMTVRTDADGRWQLVDLGRMPQRIEVHDPELTTPLLPRAVVTAVLPGGPFLDLVVSESSPQGWLTGKLVLPSTLSLEEAYLAPRLLGQRVPKPQGVISIWQPHGIVVPVDVETGDFRAGPLAPGQYQMVLTIDGAAYDLTRPVEVVVGESYDLGVLELDASASFSARLSENASEWLRERTTSWDGIASWDLTLTHHTRPWLNRRVWRVARKQAHEVIEYEHMVPGLYWLDGSPPQVIVDRLIELRAGEALNLELEVDEYFARASAWIRLCVDVRLTLGDSMRFDLYSRSGELIRSKWMDIEPATSRETGFQVSAGEYVLEISDGEITYSSTRITSRPFIDGRNDPYVNWITIGDGACE